MTVLLGVALGFLRLKMFGSIIDGRLAEKGRPLSASPLASRWAPEMLNLLGFDFVRRFRRLLPEQRLSLNRLAHDFHLQRLNTCPYRAGSRRRATPSFQSLMGQTYRRLRFSSDSTPASPRQRWSGLRRGTHRSRVVTGGLNFPKIPLWATKDKLWSGHHQIVGGVDSINRQGKAGRCYSNSYIGDSSS